MGFTRGGLLIIVGILLFLSLLLGSIFLILSWSLQYENVQKELGPILKNLTEDKFSITGEDFNLTEEMEEAREFMDEHCQNESSYVFAGGGYTFVIPCDILDEVEESPSALIDQGVENIVEQIYYDDYDCKFWNCFGKTELPLFLVSEKAKNYWQEKFYFTLIAFAVMVVLIFFLVEHKQNMPIVVGSILIASSIPLTQLEKITMGFAGTSALSFLGVFFSKTMGVFWIILVLGLVILGLGIALRLLDLDFIKKKISKKDVKRIIREETGKKKK